MISVVCVSGGLDSAVLTAIALAECAPDIPAALHVNYGQRTEARELKAYQDLCDHFQIKDRLVADLPFFSEIASSSLTDRTVAIPDGAQRDGTIPSTYVPFRNGVILSIAAAWGETLGAERLYIGAVGTDRTGYPDCRREFLEAMTVCINRGTKTDSVCEVCAPLVELTKAEIVRKGVKLGVPFELTWSCYRDETVVCGRCESCRLRLEAFAEAGVTDPTSSRPDCR